jgi:hypothetical protein
MESHKHSSTTTVLASIERKSLAPQEALKTLSLEQLQDCILRANKRPQEARNYAAEYLQRIKNYNDEKQQSNARSWVYFYLKDFAENHLSQALQHTLHNMPDYCVSEKKSEDGVMDYVYCAYPVLSDYVDLDDQDLRTMERVGLAKSLLEKKAEVTPSLVIMALGENDEAMLGLVKSKIDNDAVQKCLQEEMKYIVEGAVTPKKSKAKYSFSDGELAVKQLVRHVNFSKVSADLLNIALTRPDMSMAKDLMQAGCGIANTKLNFPQPLSYHSPMAIETARYFYEKGKELFTAYCHERLAPCFKHFQEGCKQSCLDRLFSTENLDVPQNLAEEHEARAKLIDTINECCADLCADERRALPEKLTNLEANFFKLDCELKSYSSNLRNPESLAYFGVYVTGRPLVSADDYQRSCLQSMLMHGLQHFEMHRVSAPAEKHQPTNSNRR